MYDLLSNLLSDKKGGAVFTCFGAAHVCYILLTVIAAAIVITYARKKNTDEKLRITRILSGVAFGLYMLDIFLMPLAYGEIDIEKLPFHACTAMCVCCFLSERTRLFGKYRIHFALLGFISNLIYLLYPAGVMWYQVHPLSYRVVQTLIFHGCMTVYGILVLASEFRSLEWKRCYRDLAVLCCMTLWAMLGNFIYNGNSGDYNHFFNWFFVVRDPFYLIPEAVSPCIMPFLNVAAFFAVEMLVYLVCITAARKSNR